MNKIKKATGKLLSLILAAAMCVSLVPVSSVTALAATVDEEKEAVEADLDYGIEELAGGFERKSTGKYMTDATLTYDEFYSLFNRFMNDSIVKNKDYVMDNTDFVWGYGDRWDCSAMVLYFVSYYLMPYCEGEASISDLPQRYSDYSSLVSTGSNTINQLTNWGKLIYDAEDIWDDELITEDDPGDMQPGDLIYYGYTEDYDGSGIESGYVSHVAMYLGDGKYLNDLTHLSGSYDSGSYYQVENVGNANTAWGPIEGKGANDGSGVRTDGFRLHFTNKGATTSDKNRDAIAVIRLAEIIPYGYLTLEKSSGNTSITSGNSCYDLAGAQYTVYTDSGCTKMEEDANGDDAVLTTKSDGTTNTLEMEPGTYYVKETLAAKGYALDGTVYTIEVTSDDTKDAPYTLNVTDAPQSDPVGILLEKLDEDTGEAVAQGDGSLAGAEFTVKYYDGYYTTASQVSGKSAKNTWVLRTDEDGYAALSKDYLVSGDELYYNESGDPVLPLGTVTIQETRAPTGYLLNDEIFVVQITGDGTDQFVYTYNEPEVPDTVIRGGVEVQKRDWDTLGTEPQGDAVLSDATFVIINDSTNSVRVNGVDYAKGETVLTLTTDENGHAATSSDALPYGSYILRETEAPKGYLNEGTIERTFEIREDGVIVNLTGAATENGDSAVSAEDAITDQVKRGDITPTKHDETTQEGMSVPFKVTSLTTGESHVFWTDENGDYSSDSTWNAHSYRTDAFEDMYLVDGFFRIFSARST